jgi:ketosteroid isomerase-like protein
VTEPSAEALWEIEQIKQLKARYFRLLDTKDWDGFAQLFTDDCQHVVPADPPKPAQTNAEYLFGLRAALGDGVTVHHGHMPEITLHGPTEASGTWAMSDLLDLERPDGSRLHLRGYGHYHETYRKGADGQWRISSKRNVRLRVDQTHEEQP